jgi:hypothetical protein
MRIRSPSEWSSRWWQPRDFFTAVQEYNRRQFANWDLLLHPDAAKFREAYAAGLFATIVGDHEAVAVRLESEEARFPDFHIRRNHTQYPFELVEALTPRYKRGKLYKDATDRKRRGEPPRLPRIHWLRAENSAVSTIRDAVEKKAKKSYQPSPCLLIYVSTPLFRELPFSVDEVAHGLSMWRHLFPEAWCLWGAHAVRFWPQPTSFQLVVELPALLGP